MLKIIHNKKAVMYKGRHSGLPIKKHLELTPEINIKLSELSVTIVILGLCHYTSVE